MVEQFGAALVHNMHKCELREQLKLQLASVELFSEDRSEHETKSNFNIFDIYSLDYIGIEVPFIK